MLDGFLRGEGGLHPGVLEKLCGSERREVGQGDSLESGFQETLYYLFCRKSHLAEDAALPAYTVMFTL